MKLNYTNVLTVFIFLCCSFVCNVSAQNNAPALPSIPPSPEAAALGKYGQYPVSLYNGLAQIDIPIHIISLPQINIPVSISYHASGIKVDEISTPVGLGWVLNAGGVVTRSVKGLPDDRYPQLTVPSEAFINGLGSETSKKEQLELWYRQDKGGAIDSESDIYYYNVCGLSGSFRFDNSGNIVQIPLTNNKIEKDQYMNYFQITGSDGTIYRFENKESSSFVLNSASRSYTSSWYLSWIKTTDNREISFSYTNDNTYYVEHYINYWLTASHKNPSIGTLYSSVSNVQVNSTLLPASITFPGGVIRFSYSGDRADRRKNRLTSISVDDSQGRVKSYSLEHSYFSPSGPVSFGSAQSSGNYSTNYNYRLKLDRLLIRDSRGGQFASYSFDYNTTSRLPAYLNPSSGTGPYATGNNIFYMGQDHWGYYNGVTTNKNLFTYEKHSTYRLNETEANRSVNSTTTQACILKKITYPTGGYTEFEYEGNKGTNGENTGGLRIKSVRSTPQAGASSVVRSYQYENGYSNTVGWLRFYGSAYTHGVTIETVSQGNVTQEIQLNDFYSTLPNMPLSHNGGASVFYPKVTEFDGEPNNSNGKTEYQFSFSSNSFDNQYYPRVVPSTMGSSYSFIPRFAYLYIDRGWTRGHPVRTEVYKREGNSFSIVKRTDYNYQTFKAQQVRVGFKSFQNFDALGTSLPMPYLNTLTRANEYFQYADIVAETGLVKPVQVTETSYYDGYNVTQNTSYFYDRLDNQFEVTAVHQTNSDGSVMKKNFTYPKDVNTSIYKTMADRNILSPIINTTVFKNNTFLEETQVEYSWWNSSFAAPSAVSVRRGTGQKETEISYLNYDSRGNPLHIVKNGVENIVYLWSYNYNYLVAEIKGATYEQVRNAFGNSQMEGFFSYSTPDMNNMGSILRDYFRNSLVLITTYSYKPLVGVTSVTDPKGVTMTYEYDDAGRLIMVKDKDGRSVENYIYNYKGN